MVVGFDISNSMFVDDIYPNRFEFAKQKFSTLLKELKDARVAIIGFSSRAFLIAPMTNDYNSLRYLTSNMSLDYVSLKGTSLLSALKSANMLYGEKYKGKKALLLFTDGGDKSDFSKEIEYAKTHNISVFVYATATKKGGVIKTKNGILKDKNGNIVISKLNSAIKELALKSGGAYMEYSLSKSDMKRLSKAIKKRFRAKKDKDLVIKENKELFVYPLFVSVIFLFVSLFSLPQRKRSLS
jgi:Ca-activated chloride channel family protein